MTITKAVDFGFLGDEFQLKVLSQLVCDKDFGLNIIDIMHSKYFDNEHFRQITSIIKDYNQKYDHALPSISGLKEAIIVEVKDELNKQYLISIIDKLESKSLEDELSTKNKALNFCKQQEAKKALTQCQDIINRGDFENYDLIENIMRKALEVNEEKDNAIDLYDNIDNVLSGKNKTRIRTGINGLDEALNGGPAKKEVACLIAPTGVGKSTFLTKVANTAHNDKLNVLQLIFEDDETDIQAKHYTCITGIELNDLEKTKTYVKEKLEEFKIDKGLLKIKVCKKMGTTVPHIRQFVRNYKNKGIVFDLIVLDYLDCMAASRDINGEVGDEGTIIADLEELAKEFDLLIWLAIQSNRCLALDTIVDIPNGKIQLKDIKENDLILTHKGFKKVEKIYPIENQTVYKIKTKSGKEIICSSRHIFPTSNGYNSIELGLQIGDKFLIKK